MAGISLTDEIAEAIFDRMAEGASISEILASSEMPSRQTFYKALREDSDLADRYTRAGESRAEYLADEIVKISDEQAEVVTEDGRTFDPDVNRDRLRIDARKWYASKVHPKKYGDKVETTMVGDSKRPVCITATQHDENV